MDKEMKTASENAKKVPFKEGMIGPTVVLLIICLVVSGALAFTYQLTEPQINKINKENADASRLEVLPGAETFTEIPTTASDASSSLSLEGVTEYYVADNGAGVVITTQNSSFGGTITVMTGIDTDGVITGVKITDHSDTPGLGTKAQDSAYLEEQYVGKDSTDYAGSIKDDSQVEAVTGATVSSNGIYGAVNYALRAFSEVGTGDAATGGEN